MNAARLILCVVFVAVMTWLWYPYFTKPTPVQGDADDQAAVPDYIATSLSQSIFNDQGQLSHKVYAEQMQMFEELGYTYFEQPRFTLFNDGASWEVTAQEATLYKNNILILENDVIATNLKEGAMINKVQAAAIEIDIDAHRMESAQPVELTGPNVMIKGQGLKADMDTEIVELNNHSKTVYYDQ